MKATPKLRTLTKPTLTREIEETEEVVAVLTRAPEPEPEPEDDVTEESDSEVSEYVETSGPAPADSSAKKAPGRVKGQVVFGVDAFIGGMVRERMDLDPNWVVPVEKEEEYKEELDATLLALAAEGPDGIPAGKAHDQSREAWRDLIAFFAMRVKARKLTQPKSSANAPDPAFQKTYQKTLTETFSMVSAGQNHIGLEAAVTAYKFVGDAAFKAKDSSWIREQIKTWIKESKSYTIGGGPNPRITRIGR